MALSNTENNRRMVGRLIEKRFSGSMPPNVHELTAKEEEILQEFNSLVLQAEAEFERLAEYWDRWVPRRGTDDGWTFDGQEVEQIEVDPVMELMRKAVLTSRKAKKRFGRMKGSLRKLYPHRDYVKVLSDVIMMCDGIARTINDEKHPDRVNIYYHNYQDKRGFYIDEVQRDVAVLQRRFRRLHDDNLLMRKTRKGWSVLGLGGIAASLLAAGLFVPAGNDARLMDRVIDAILTGGSFLPGLGGMMSDLTSLAVGLVRSDYSSNGKDYIMNNDTTKPLQRFEGAGPVPGPVPGPVQRFEAAKRRTGKEEAELGLVILTIVGIWAIPYIVKFLQHRHKVRNTKPTFLGAKEIKGIKLASDAIMRMSDSLVLVYKAIKEGKGGANRPFLELIDKLDETSTEAHRAIGWLPGHVQNNIANFLGYGIIANDLHALGSMMGSTLTGDAPSGGTKNVMKHDWSMGGTGFDADKAEDVTRSLLLRMKEMHKKNPTLIENKKRPSKYEAADQSAIAVGLLAEGIMSPDTSDKGMSQILLRGIIGLLNWSILLPITAVMLIPAFVGVLRDALKSAFFHFRKDKKYADRLMKVSSEPEPATASMEVGRLADRVNTG